MNKGILTIDDYINEQNLDIQPLLREIKKTISLAAPKAIQRISWKMPTFWQGENIIHFAVAKKHIGIYPGGEATLFFADRLKGYKTSKGTIQLPINKPIDYELISDITIWRVRQVEGSQK